MLDYLIWHHFGYYPEERAHDLFSQYKHYFGQDVQPANLAKLAEQFIWRNAIDIDRENNMEQKGDTKTLKVRGLFFLSHSRPCELKNKDIKFLDSISNDNTFATIFLFGVYSYGIIIKH